MPPIPVKAFAEKKKNLVGNIVLYSAEIYICLALQAKFKKYV